MTCRRCQGLMSEDQFFDFEGTHGFMWQDSVGKGCVAIPQEGGDW